MTHYDEEIDGLMREAEIMETRINWMLLGMAIGSMATVAFFCTI